MTQIDSFVHISYIIERHSAFPEDLKERFKVIKKTAAQFDDNIIHDVSSDTRKVPIDFAGTSLSIDDNNLNMYKVDIRLKVDDSKGMTEKKLLELAAQWGNQLRNETDTNRRVICHTSIRLEDGTYRDISQN